MTPTQLRTLAYCDSILNAPQAHLDLEGSMLLEEIQIGIDHLSEFMHPGNGWKIIELELLKEKTKERLPSELFS